jgi:hypothetical protein
MPEVLVEICRYVDDHPPGWVECKLTDGWGREWTFVEKVPVVTAAYLDANSAYPQPGHIACRVVERRQDADGREVVTIDTEQPWGVESTTGEVRFEVRPNQLTESNHD